jgi:hypothetical protein
MSTNKTLFQEAIADAKAVREAALANAKAALEETMTPRLQSMLAARLEENYEEGMGDTSFDTEEKTNMEEDLDLSEILAELEKESQLEEAKKKGKKDEEEEDEEEDEEEEVENEEDDEEYSPEVENEEEARPTEIKDMNVEELLDLVMDKLEGKIADIVQQEMGTEASADKAEEPEMGMNPMGSEPAPAGEEEININELLAELDAMYEGDEKNMKEEGFMDTMRGIGKNISKQVFLMGAMDKVTNGRKVPVSRQERQTDWNATNGDRQALEDMGYVFNKTWKDDKEMTMSQSDRQGALAEKEMNEAIRTIKTLRSELNEVNLLNAKLIYVNKIFKSKSLTEAQKIQVITSFDKATTTREAKVVFESLTTALAAPKKPLKESYGFASRAAGLAPRKQIVESNDVVARMQKLANIIK